MPAAFAIHIAEEWFGGSPMSPEIPVYAKRDEMVPPPGLEPGWLLTDGF